MAFSSEVIPVREKKTRQNKKLKPCSDLTRTGQALACFGTKIKKIPAVSCRDSSFVEPMLPVTLSAEQNLIGVLILKLVQPGRLADGVARR